jgi:hypothetical protein
MEAPTRSKPKTKKLSRGKRASVSVADRVKTRKRMDELQREIEDISRRIEAERYLGEIVKLRRLFEEKDNERDRLYKEIQNENKTKAKNNPKNALDIVKKKTLQERRANNKTKKNMKDQMKKDQMQNVMRPRINATTLKLKDRKALNLEHMYQMKKEEDVPKELRSMVKETQPQVKPKVTYDVSEKAYYAMKEDGDVPKELKSMIIRDKPPLKKRPKPKQANVSL